MPAALQNRSTQTRRVARALAFFARVIPPFLLLLSLYALTARPAWAQSGGGLTVEIIAGPNLVVDSNVASASSYAPSVATVIGKFCNTSGADLIGVQGFIGNWDGAASTPGVYPSRNSTDPAFMSQHPLLANSGSYQYTHIGGSAGLSDATRTMGTIPAGECRVQYWHFTYPRRENPNNSGDPVWGNSNSYTDDLWLDFDIWAFPSGGSAATAAYATHRMTMRSEISAQANKIEPNDGEWFNTKSSEIYPGDVITSNGVNYELGLINKGFDNDGDLAYDYNAWLQPVGDPAYDPSCFRMIRTTGVLYVSRSGGLPDLVIPFQDSLYFTDLPPDNTGVRGDVRYTFVALDGPCTTTLSPYQEVASGADNEKFNSDYGTGVPPIVSLQPQVTISKTADPFQVALGGQITYDVPVSNIGNMAAGQPDYSLPLVVSDTLPAGLVLVSATLDGPASYLYSVDGSTWTSTLPAGARHVQAWLGEQLPPGEARTLTIVATVPLGYTGSPLLENNACISYGAEQSFACASAVSILQGPNAIGDLVWRDIDADGVKDSTELGLPNITVKLYWDRTGNGVLDANDPLIAITSSGMDGSYAFTGMPNGSYLVQVDNTDADIPTGFNTTTKALYAVTGLGTTTASPYNSADFGFGPVLRVDKMQTVANPVLEGDNVTYRVDLTNTRPGSGTGLRSTCTYTTWASAMDAATDRTGTGTKAFEYPINAYTPPGPDDVYATAPFKNAGEMLGVTGFNQGIQAGSIMTVEMLLPVRARGTFATGAVIDVNLFYGPGTTALRTQRFTAATLGNTTLVMNVTGARAWTWADFTGTALTIQMVSNKGTGTADGVVDWDAAAFRIQTDQKCGSVSDTLSIVPLTDTYDHTRLQFVSSTPMPDSQASGSLIWDNLGPLYPGQTKSVSLTFKTLPFNGVAENTTINYASVTGAFYSDSRPANDGNDSVETRIANTGSLAGRVWNDLDNDGIDDAEPGISGVKVTLMRRTANNSYVEFATTFTGPDGSYLFTKLPDDASRDDFYQVVVDPLTLPGTTYTQTHDPDVVGRCSGAQCDHKSGDILVNANDIGGVNFAYTVPNTVFGSVWEDNDGDGVKDLGENGISGISVALVCNGAPVQTQTTGADGSYMFTDVANQPAACRVVVNGGNPPAGYTQTVDPDGTFNNETTTPAPVTGGRIFGPYDFAYHRSGSLTIGDTIYVDWNGNGLQDTGEEGIPEVTVRLYEDSNGDGVVDPAVDAFIAADVTDSSGGYSFGNLAGGLNYVVVVDLGEVPPDYLQTADPDQDGVCTVCDSRARVTLTAADDLTIDFGYRPTGFGSIGDFVWRDMDHDSTQDAGETGIANITVWLYEDSGTLGVYEPATDALVAATSTNASGLYTIGSLPAGNYLVDVDTNDADLPLDASDARYRLSTANNPQAVTLADMQVYTAADFGFTPGGVIGDFVWNDNNANGLFDAGETGAAGVSVSLYGDANGNGVYDTGEIKAALDQTTVTSGYYAFTGLPAGAYVVVINTTRAITGDPDVTPPCGGACNNQSGAVLTTGQVDRTRDFGLAVPVPIGDTLWIDADNNGARDAGEAGLRNVAVSLYRDTNGSGSYDAGDALAATTATDPDGLYSFGNAGDGTFFVVVSGALPAGLAVTYEPDALNGWTRVVVTGGLVTQVGDTPCTGCAMNADFGYRWSGSFNISGTVFFDAGEDGGLYMPGADTPYAGIPVYLWKGGVLIATALSDANGLYTFSGLPAGDYAVSVNTGSTLLAGMTLKTPEDNPYYRPVTITNADVPNNDFGFHATLDFGDLSSTYSLTHLGDEGPRHLLSGLALGPGISAEPDGMESDNASRDANDDGVAPTPGVSWSPTEDGASIDVTVSGGAGYLSGWIDWNHDNDFDDEGERVLLDELVGAGSQTLTFDVPSSVVFGASFFARWRLYPASTGGVASPYGWAPGGEVEDYQWAYSPTAITLRTLSAASPRNAAMPLAVLALGLLAACAAWAVKKTR